MSMKADHAWVRRRRIMLRSGAVIMSWGDLGGAEELSLKGGPQFCFLQSSQGEGRLAQIVVRELREMCRQERRSVDWQHSWLVIKIFAAPVARPRNCTCFHAALSERRVEWDFKTRDLLNVLAWEPNPVKGQIGGFWVEWVSKVFDLKGYAFLEV
jgi:hypothetical protein